MDDSEDHTASESSASGSSASGLQSCESSDSEQGYEQEKVGTGASRRLNVDPDDGQSKLACSSHEE